MAHYKHIWFAFILMSQMLFAFQKDAVVQFKDSIRVEVAQLSDSLRAQRYYNASFYALRHLNDLSLSRSYADSAMFYARTSGFKDSEAKSHFQYGLLDRIEGHYDSALEHLDTNIQYFKTDSTLVAYSLFQIGVIHRALGNYDKSLETYLDILNIFEKKKDSFAIASTLNSIGNIYGEMKKPDEAISNFSDALTIFESKKSLRDIGNAHENISKMYLLKNDTLAAKMHVDKALEIARTSQEDYQIARVLSTLGKLNLSSDIEAAYQYLLEAKQIFEDKDFRRDLIPIYRDLGTYYQKKANYKQAFEAYQTSLNIAEDYNEQPYLRDVYFRLSELHHALGDYKQAFDYQKQYVVIKDSLFNSESLETINRLQKQFEVKKKDNEIYKQQLLLETQKNEIQKKNMWFNYTLGLVFLLVLISVSIWLVYKQRQKRKDQELVMLKNEAQINSLESLIEGEEKERLRIAKELHDGVNGDLSAIKHKLNTLLELNNTTIKEAVVMIDKSCEQVRAISHNLVPPALENFDLQSAISDYCTNMNNIHKPLIQFDYLGDDVTLPKLMEVNIYRITQELVINSIKHAEASEINVQLSVRNNTVQLAVDDDGKGFDTAHVQTDGIGISNIKSRVAFLNGEIDFVSSEKGTSVNIFIDKSKYNHD
ncbi:tetratricopeptide repeat-containing sensor histidine kinase [Psychroserpens algicola]|uniref:tetratricopeptide repeat-containing sensor histidine kinase n=1 Tax=Psychroserpens algicola TaxID=1719034 RepID=UPI0019546513|nr:tetratricopeptide repeat protein [Psychroserpens algicola]